MIGILAKIGGTILTGLGIDWAVTAANNSDKEQRRATVGKVVVGSFAIYLGLKLLKKLR